MHFNIKNKMLEVCFKNTHPNIYYRAYLKSGNPTVGTERLTERTGVTHYSNAVKIICEKSDERLCCKSQKSAQKQGTVYCSLFLKYNLFGLDILLHE